MCIPLAAPCFPASVPAPRGVGQHGGEAAARPSSAIPPFRGWAIGLLVDAGTLPGAPRLLAQPMSVQETKATGRPQWLSLACSPRVLGSSAW